MKRLPAWVLALALPLALVQAALATGAPPAAEFAGFDKSWFEIQTRLGQVRFEVYLANTQEQQERGLMFVRQLPAHTGMLFPQRTPNVMTMWMKNTLIPLDMLFVGADGRVACVRPDAVPQSLALISCNTPAREVLEIAGGEARKFGIEVGNKVRHPAIAR